MIVVGHVLDAVRAHAAREAPNECCGIVLETPGARQEYVPCENILPGEVDRFAISGSDFAAASVRGRVALICHSHVNRAPRASGADRIGCEATQLPWLIVNHPVGTWTLIEPSGYSAPYAGREFVHGIVDCYTLVRDWYAREMGLELPNFHRPDGWWNAGLNLYEDNLEACGFKRVEDDPRVGDLYLMRLRSKVVNHGAVLVEPGRILHHPPFRLSGVDAYGGFWRKVAAYRARYVGKEGACAT